MSELLDPDTAPFSIPWQAGTTYNPNVLYRSAKMTTINKQWFMWLGNQTTYNSVRIEASIQLPSVTGEHAMLCSGSCCTNSSIAHWLDRSMGLCAWAHC